MKKAILYCSCLLSISCSYRNSDTAFADSSLTREDSARIIAMIDSQTNASLKKAILDTAGLYMAPVKVVSAKIVEEEYSSYRNLALSFKNVSGKTISAIKFTWYGENAFGEPADMGGLLEGMGGGFFDRALKPNKTASGEYHILSRDGKTVIAWPEEVVFEDGTKWKIN